MTHETAKQLKPIFDAFAEGKTIQFNYSIEGWKDILEPDFSSLAENYRIKPEIVNTENDEKKYRPFKDCDELITTFQKKIEKETELGHIIYPVLYKPCIWVRHKDFETTHLVTSFGMIKATDISTVEISGITFTMKELFDSFEFLDGSPCGAEE